MLINGGKSVHVFGSGFSLKYNTYEGVNRLLATALESGGGRIGTTNHGEDIYLRPGFFAISPRGGVLKHVIPGLSIYEDKYQGISYREVRNNIIKVCREWKRINGYEFD